MGRAGSNRRPTRRVFVSYAGPDARSRERLITQVRDAKLPASFVEMAIKAPGDSLWRLHCRQKIKSADAMLVLVSRQTAHASGVLWEVACARREGVPICGIHVDSAQRPESLPTELTGLPIIDWEWSAIAALFRIA